MRTISGGTNSFSKQSCRLIVQINRPSDYDRVHGQSGRLGSHAVRVVHVEPAPLPTGKKSGMGKDPGTHTQARKKCNYLTAKRNFDVLSLLLRSHRCEPRRLYSKRSDFLLCSFSSWLS